MAAVLAHCYAEGVPITTRGGGTGFAGGAVPQGGIVLSTARMARVRAFDPLQWRIHVEAGLPTAELRRIVRGSGLWFPPDPGAAEQSQIGGNVATNAGGPHAFKYGTTRAWVTGIEAVIPPGEIVTTGGPVRKNVAGYDLVGLLAGSEGTLGIVTAAWLRLIPAVEAALPIAALFAGVDAGCTAVEALMGSGVVPACIEYVDEPALAATGHDFPGRPARPRASWSSPRRTDPRPRRPPAARRCARRWPEPGRRGSQRRTGTTSPPSGAGATRSRRASPPSAAASSPRTSPSPSTGSPTRSAGRPRSGPGTASRP